MLSRLPLLALGLFACTLIAGCGGAKAVPLEVTVVAPASLKLEDTDQITVAFIPEGGGGTAGGGSGSYKEQPIKMNGPGKSGGIAPGKYKITVSITPYAGMGKEDRSQKLEDFSKSFDGSTSKLAYEVSSDGNQSLVIDLGSGSVTKK